MLNGKVSVHNDEHILLIQKAYDPNCFDNMYNDVSYSDMIGQTESNVFNIMSEEFLKIANISLQKSGRNIARNIEVELIKIEVVKDWLNSAVEECRAHREYMIQLFVRAKVFRLVKDINEKWRQSKSWKQTRRDLRNQ